MIQETKIGQRKNRQSTVLGGWFLSVLLMVAVTTAPEISRAQCSAEDLEAQIQLQDIVSQAQAISLSTLGFSRSEQGQQVATFFIANNSDQVCEDLYMKIIVENTSVGKIVELNQEGNPIDLQPHQVIRATNLELRHGIPEVPGPLNFTGGLTAEGEEFVNRLKGQTSLPDDIYSVSLEIYQERISSGPPSASASASVGQRSLSSTQDIYINSPGGEAGSGVDFVINNRQPQFDWSGETGETYRLVIVEAGEAESPESLLEGARSTPAVVVDNQNVGNTLLEYEMTDVQLTNSNFRYPTSGVKQLEPGQKYYWQVTTLVQSPDGEQENHSEIWSFTVNERGASDKSDSRMTEQMRKTLRILLGSENYSRVQKQDLNLQSVVIDGQRYTGQQMIQKLNELIEQARRGDITVVH